MKVGICDDEMCFVQATRHLLEEWAGNNNIPITIYEFLNGDDLLREQMVKKLDLIILDVIMPLLDGMDTARELRSYDQKVPIIFLTSSKDFAVDSYDVRAFYYLLKPLQRDVFFRVMDSFLNDYGIKKEAFFARIAGGSCNITLDETEVLEAQNKQVVVTLANGTILEIRELFSDCADVFTPDKGFFRCHRSYIVNMNYIEQFTQNQVITRSGMVVPISRNKYMAFKEAYFSYMFE